MSKTFEGFTPHPKQKEMLDSIINGNEKYHVIASGRQFGKTLLAQNLLLYWGINERPANILWVSPIYSQVRQVHQDLYSAIADSGIVKNNNFSSNELELHTGSKITFRSAERYDGIRGATYTHAVIDEAAFVKDEAWAEAIKPTLIVNGRRIVMISTPKGKNWFHNLYQLGKNPDHPQYKSYKGSSYDTPYIDDLDIEEAKRTVPENIFKQEYLAEFLDSGGEVFSNIDRNQRQDRGQGPYFMGVDWGKADDYTSAIVLDHKGQIVDHFRRTGGEWSTMIEEVSSLAKKYTAQVMVEVNGIGDPLFAQLRLKYPKTDPFVTTNKSKQEIIEGLILDMNELTIGIPPRHEFPSLWSEMEVFTYDYNPKTRSIRYTHPPGYHDDNIIALGIANWCRKQRSHYGSYTVMGSSKY